MKRQAAPEVLVAVAFIAVLFALALSATVITELWAKALLFALLIATAIGWYSLFRFFRREIAASRRQLALENPSEVLRVVSVTNADHSAFKQCRHPLWVVPGMPVTSTLAYQRTAG